MQRIWRHFCRGGRGSSARAWMRYQFDHIAHASRTAIELAEDDARLGNAPLHVLLYSGATLARALVVASRAHALADGDLDDVDRLMSARDVIMTEIRRRFPAPASPDAA